MRGGRPWVCDEGRCRFLPFPARHPPCFFPPADSSAEGSTQIPKGSFQGHREYVSPLVCVIRVGAVGRSSSLYQERGVRRALEAELQNRLLVPPAVPPPSPGRDLRAPSGLPTSADSACSHPLLSALILVAAPSLGTLLPPWAPQLGLCPQPGIPLGTEAAHVPVLLSALPGPHLARRLHQVP